MKIDLKRDRKDFYQPGSKDFVTVEVPPMTYLAIDGHGDPNSTPAYAVAVESLYTVGYAIKFGFRKRTGDDFVVGPLEGLWSSADPAAFVSRDKDAWDWTMLIALPHQVRPTDITDGLSVAATKKPHLPIDRISVMDLHEGRCLQILHIGPYDDEGPTLARLHNEIMPKQGLTWNGPHHEIYLSDPRRSAPHRLRTVLRQPVKPL